MQVAFVLRSGGVYKPEHVEALAEQVLAHAPRGKTISFLCLTDFSPFDFDKCSRFVNIVPLKYNYPGWWSKMELFRPDIKGGLLYFDLDSAIIGPLDDIFNVSKLTIVRDFYRDGVYKGRPEGLQSCMMYLPEVDRREVWTDWSICPGTIMADCLHGGDQKFLERRYLTRSQRWQDVVPDQVVSYKVHVRGKGVPSNARVVCAHGKPKLWDTPEFKHLYE